MDWLTRLMVDTPQPKKETAAAPASQATLVTPVANEPEPTLVEASEPANDAATYDTDAITEYPEPLEHLAYWQARAEAAEAELAAIPDALRQPPAGYEWVGEIQVDTINNGVWLPFRKVTREVTITLPSDATDEEVIAAFRAAAE